MATRNKISRKELLKEPDQFLTGSEKAMLYLMDNRGAVLGCLVSGLIAVSSYFGFKYYEETKTLSNEAIYFQMETIASNGNGSDLGSEMKILLDQLGEGFQKGRGSLLLADVYFQNNELDKAKSLYLSVINHSEKGRFNYQLAQLGLANTYASQKDYKKAIGVHKSIIEANTSFPLFESYWSLSKCYEMDNDKANSLLVLREMQIKFSENPQLEKVKQRIKQLSA